MKLGIPALAEVYGQSRPEFHQLKELAARLLDHLQSELDRFIPIPGDLDQAAETADSFAAFCADSTFAHTLVMLSDGCVAVLLRVDHEFSFALIDAVLGPGQRPAAPAGPDEAPRALTITETHILETMLAGAFTAAVKRAFDDLIDDDTRLQVIPLADLAHLEALDLPDQILAANAHCTLGNRTCSIGIGLPMSGTLESKAKSERVAPGNGSSHAGDRAKTIDLLSAATLELRAVLGTATIPLAEIRAFAAGSIILLHKLNSGLPQVELCCGGQVLCSGTVVEDHGWHKFLLHQEGE